MLLRRHLTPEQWDQWQTWRGIIMRGPMTGLYYVVGPDPSFTMVYRSMESAASGRLVIHGSCPCSLCSSPERLDSICIYAGVFGPIGPEPALVPPEDTLLAKKLLIEANEWRFNEIGIHSRHGWQSRFVVGQVVQADQPQVGQETQPS